MAENGQETAESLLQDIQKKITEAFEVRSLEVMTEGRAVVYHIDGSDLLTIYPNTHN